MTEPSWIQLEKDHKVTAAAKEGNVWQPAVIINAPGFLKIVATGEWTYSTKYMLKCQANGDLHSPFDPASSLHAESPMGCLIGRIGGSSATKTSADVFTVGAYCLRKLEAGKEGPLYLACNDLWTGFGDNTGELTVNIFFIAKLS